MCSGTPNGNQKASRPACVKHLGVLLDGRRPPVDRNLEGVAPFALAKPTLTRSTRDVDVASHEPLDGIKMTSNWKYPRRIDPSRSVRRPTWTQMSPLPMSPMRHFKKTHCTS